MAQRYPSGFFSKRKTVGMESEEVQVAEREAAAAQGDGTAGAETAETEMLETQELMTEGDDREAAIEEAEVVMDEIEDDMDTLEVASESGGLDRVAADILTRSVNGRLARIGISPARMPATESFGRASSRASNTRLAMEALSDKLKQIWKAILDAIKKATRWVRDIFNKFFGTFESLAKRAKAINERAGDTSGSLTSENKKINNDRIFKQLAINNNIDTKKVTDFLDKAEDWFTKGFGDQNKYVEDVVDALGDVDEDSFFDEPKDNNYEPGNDKYANKEATAILSGKAEISDDKLKGFLPGYTLSTTGSPQLTKDFSDQKANYSDELPGNMAMVITNIVGTPDLTKMRVRLTTYDSKRTVREGKDFATLSTGTVSDLADKIETLAAEAIRARKDADKMANNKDKLLKEAERLSKLDFDRKKYTKDATTNNYNANDEDDDKANKAGRDSAKTLRKLITNLNSFTGDFQTKYTGYVVNVCKATLDYCELSLKAYDNSRS